MLDFQWVKWRDETDDRALGSCSQDWDAKKDVFSSRDLMGIREFWGMLEKSSIDTLRVGGLVLLRPDVEELCILADLTISKMYLK